MDWAGLFDALPKIGQLFGFVALACVTGVVLGNVYGWFVD